MLLLNCAKGEKVQNCTICRLDRRSGHQGGVGEGQRGVQDWVLVAKGDHDDLDHVAVGLDLEGEVDVAVQVTQPVLVLHSDDDPIVPAYLGQRLVERTKEAGEDDGDGKGKGYGEGETFSDIIRIMTFDWAPQQTLSKKRLPHIIKCGSMIL